MIPSADERIVRRKCKGGLLMGRKKLAKEKLAEIEALASNLGKEVAERVLEGGVASAGMDLQAMEQITQAATTSLTKATLEAIIQKQTRSLAPLQPCPVCQCLCRVGYEERPLIVKGGQITLSEAVCSCPNCKRDFFPPADFSASG